MAHPRVEQLRFARSEWQRGLAGLSEVDAGIRYLPMNSISWMVGHMAWHERQCWMRRARGLEVERALAAFASGQPASVPSFTRMQEAWQRIVAGADPFLDSLTTADLEVPLAHDPREHPPSAGSQLLVVTYHYCAPTGEVSAVRQLLVHAGLGEYVGDLGPEAQYRPEG
ncbi:MAG: DinB family protein [Chloroflexi bacterium]|nr:DinB family protein [Chloroflexota bacterium]